MNNPQPTEAALRCAETISAYIGKSHQVQRYASHIDAVCQLPQLTAIALAAQGVVDVVNKPMPSTHWEPDPKKDLEWLSDYLSNVQSAVGVLSATLEELNHTKP